MSEIRLVSLDCAGTLVRVNWEPARFAVDCAEKVGLPLERGHAESEYLRLLQIRWRDYQELNQTRDPGVLDDFWRKLNLNWLEGLGVDPNWAEPIFMQGWEDLYGPHQKEFSLFPDTVPALERLSHEGYRLAILSNWDYSLHRVVNMLGMAPFFEEVVASLEVGVEKPDPALFSHLFERTGVKPEEVLHVGDDPLDDVRGAANAGCRGLLLDRDGKEELPYRVTDLSRIPEAIAWSG